MLERNDTIGAALLPWPPPIGDPRSMHASDPGYDRHASQEIDDAVCRFHTAA